MNSRGDELDEVGVDELGNKKEAPECRKALRFG